MKLTAVLNWCKDKFDWVSVIRFWAIYIKKSKDEVKNIFGIPEKKCKWRARQSYDSRIHRWALQKIVWSKEFD